MCGKIAATNHYGRIRDDGDETGLSPCTQLGRAPAQVGYGDQSDEGVAGEGKKRRQSSYLSTDAAHRERGQVAPSSIGSVRFGTCCSVRNSACCEGKIIARPRPGGCRPDAGVRCNRRLVTSVVAHSLSRCTSCALLERSPRAFLREPPVESAVPELHLARKSAVLEKRAFH